MRLALQDLCVIHRVLRGHPVDLSRCGGLALQRARHTSPVDADLSEDGIVGAAQIEWLLQDPRAFEALDEHRVTEDGAEAIALSYANAKAGWIVKRRLQRGERADWLLNKNSEGWLALEVSGTTLANPQFRLEEKKRQVALCSLPVDRLAVVVSFEKPSILVASP
jgi:hypothetical protein